MRFARRTVGVDPGDDRAQAGTGGRSEAGRERLRLNAQVPGAPGPSRARRSATATTVAAGDIAWRPSRSTTRPATSPSMVNTNVPADAPVDPGSAQIVSDQVGLDKGLSEPTNTGRSDVRSRVTSAASRKRG